MNGNSPFLVQIDLSLVAVSILCLMPVVWVIVIVRRRLGDYRKRNKLPFKELKRRPAGEYLRVKIEGLNDQINDHLFFMLGMPFGLAFAIHALKIHNPVAWLLFFATCTAWTLAFKGKLIRLMEECRNYQLGFNGERFVGEELSRLIALGYEIYHDVPFDGFNMDHVLVGKLGVFVVETKTRSKPVDESDEKKYEVKFDGKLLHWPWGRENQDIKQACNNASTLSKWLSSATGQSVDVSAILTFPGWWVDRAGRCEGIYIVNPEEIIQVCDSKKVKFEEASIKRICHQLNQKCRIEIK